ILTAVHLFAQKLPTPLGLEDAWQIALKKNLSLKQVEKSIRQAEEEIKIQRTEFLPSIGGFASYRYQSEIPSLEIPGQGP
ncbi:MAG: TolC family protein, partial [Calditrichae bacterium]|nr:TolC family protein [Calditrichia bacterium]